MLVYVDNLSYLLKPRDSGTDTGICTGGCEIFRNKTFRISEQNFCKNGTKLIIARFFVPYYTRSGWKNLAATWAFSTYFCSFLDILQYTFVSFSSTFHSPLQQDFRSSKNMFRTMMNYIMHKKRIYSVMEQTCTHAPLRPPPFDSSKNWYVE